MIRSLWKGAIVVGLMTIPVKLYAATEARDQLAFHMLCRKCGQRINLRTHCAEHGELDRTRDTIKGYEVERGRYIPLEDAELDSLRLPSLHSIAIDRFVPRLGPPRFAKGHYYIAPEPLGAKAFALLAAGMQARRVDALAKITIREREQPCFLSFEGGTVMNLITVHWPDEIRSIEAITSVMPALADAEIKMAEQLVKALTKEGEPMQDGYKQAVLDLIEAKLAGADAGILSPVTPSAPPVDIMAVLAASIEEAKKGTA